MYVTVEDFENVNLPVDTQDKLKRMWGIQKKISLEEFVDSFLDIEHKTKALCALLERTNSFEAHMFSVYCVRRVALHYTGNPKKSLENTSAVAMMFFKGEATEEEFEVSRGYVWEDCAGLIQCLNAHTWDMSHEASIRIASKATENLLSCLSVVRKHGMGATEILEEKYDGILGESPFKGASVAENAIKIFARGLESLEFSIKKVYRAYRYAELSNQITDLVERFRRVCP